jgi:hypothetical protein
VHRQSLLRIDQVMAAVILFVGNCDLEFQLGGPVIDRRLFRIV